MSMENGKTKMNKILKLLWANRGAANLKKREIHEIHAHPILSTHPPWTQPLSTHLPSTHTLSTHPRYHTCCKYTHCNTHCKNTCSQQTCCQYTLSTHPLSTHSVNPCSQHTHCQYTLSKLLPLQNFYDSLSFCKNINIIPKNQR